MMNESKTREEWQKIVNDFNPEQQSKKDYCSENNLKYGSFRNWYYKLKPTNGLIKEAGVESKSGVSKVKKELVNKEFIEFRFAPNTTKINLPNGINIEIVADDVIGLIKKLMYVA